MALEKKTLRSTMVLDRALGRETNLSQKAERRSGYGILRLKKIVGIRDFWPGGGGGGGGEIEEIRDIF